MPDKTLQRTAPDVAVTEFGRWACEFKLIMGNRH